MYNWGIQIADRVENIVGKGEIVENIVGKGEISRYEQFLLFATMFLKAVCC